MPDQYAYYSQNHNTEKTNNRVYINPNFNRSDNVPASSSMYFNPNFSHVSPNLHFHNRIQDHKDQTSKVRIHINPNFKRNANVTHPKVVNISEKTTNKPSPIIDYSLNNQIKQDLNQQSQATFAHVTKSRYCLLRQKESLMTKTPLLRPVSNTVRVNKYKSVSLNVVKNNLATANPTNSTQDASLQSYQPLSSHTRFKFVKIGTATILNESQAKHVPIRRYSSHTKSLLKTPGRENNKLILKKNNIPCPLYKKYGKCLRKTKGNCEYLHDKKHVSICRKFLKGICHNADCLLSHDMTDKKMPTCYFYLQGACTKENCPYLHVKLNEKTKICQDFRRGYCEKGDKCLFRHTDVCGDMALKEVCSKKQLPYSPGNKINPVIKLKSRKKYQIMLNQENKNSNKMLEGPHAEDQRYFKESVENKSLGENCDMIKPSRIKLGTLPSFIQI